MGARSRYVQIIEKIFLDKHQPGRDFLDFERDQIPVAATSLGVDPPRNLGDVIYTFRYRQDLPASIRATAPPVTAEDLARYQRRLSGRSE